MSVNFNRVVWVYDFLAKLVFFGAIRRSQKSLLGSITESSRVLIIGGGTGYILNDIRKISYPQIVYVEPSTKMISRAKKRDYPSDKIDFRCEEFKSADKEEFDVVITSYFLDLFEGEELKNVMTQIEKRIKKYGVWLFTDFNENIPSMGFFKRALLKTLFTFFRLTCGIKSKKLGQFSKNFESLGLSMLSEKFFYGRMIQAKSFRKTSS